jgi:hypothetical protein
MENQESAEAAGFSEDVEMWYTMLCWCFYICMFLLKYIDCIKQKIFSKTKGIVTRLKRE